MLEFFMFGEIQFQISYLSKLKKKPVICNVVHLSLEGMDTSRSIM